MRILHVAHGAVFGGIETMLVTIARSAHSNPKLDCAFAICFDGRLADELRKCGANASMLGETHASQPATVWRARRRLERLLSTGAFDVVLTHGVWPLAAFGPVAVHAHIPLVFWQHGPITGRHWTEWWARLASPQAVISNSQFSAQSARSFFPRVPSEVLYCPVASPSGGSRLSNRAVVRGQLDTSLEATVVIQVSRMEAWKGQHDHLRALHRIRDERSWMCWIVGGAQTRAETKHEDFLKQAAIELGVEDRVRFLGQRADVSALLNAADIYCQPNTEPEPFGIALVEALYAGLPVVTTSLGGALEIVDNRCGLFVTRGEVAELAEALRWVMCNGEFQQRVRSEGPIRAQHLCDPKGRLEQLAHFLSGIVGEQ